MILLVADSVNLCDAQFGDSLFAGRLDLQFVLLSWRKMIPKLRSKKKQNYTSFFIEKIEICNRFGVMPSKSMRNCSSVQRRFRSPFAGERSFFKPLVPDHKTVSIPEEHFYMIPAPIEKNKKCAG